MRKDINDFDRDWLGLTLLAARRWEKDKTPFPVTIGKVEDDTRTKKQNKLIHALFKQCADKAEQILQNGNILFKDADWWKSELKCKLGKKQVHFDLEDNPTVLVVSTSQYNKKEISDFVIKIQQHMMEKYQVSIDTNEINMFLNQGE